MVSKSKLSFKQLCWLESQGGRDEDDIEEDATGFFFLVYSFRLKLDKKIYVPPDNQIPDEFLLFHSM